MAGRPCTYCPEFTPDALEMCRELIRRRKAPYVKVQRARLALLLHCEPGLDSVAAAYQLGLSEQVVRKWRRRWCQEPFALEDQPRSGRPPIFSPRASGACESDRLRAAGETRPAALAV